LKAYGTVYVTPKAAGVGAAKKDFKVATVIIGQS
jgi:hypothetical protein